MDILTIIFIFVYILCLGSYFFSETSGNFKRRAINKIILASMFFIFGVVTYSINFSFTSYHILLLLAITFAYIGDILLLFSFSKGGISFITSNILFFIYEIFVIVKHNLKFSQIWYFIILLLAIIGIFYIITKTKKIDLKDKRIPILVYISSVTLHATLSIFVATSLKTISFYILSFGLNLFMISDYFLMAHKFKYPNKKWVLRCNSGFYFIGLLLVVLSLIY